jgi:hypothetical protein
MPPLQNFDLLPVVQAHVARATLGPSALRRQGIGVANAARPFFATLSLAPFATRSPPAFARQLNFSTDALTQAFPAGSGSWGLARKLLNIFLREALYNHYLAAHYGLHVAERLFEVPLDSITGGHIYRLSRGTLRSWPGVKHLTPELNASYQAVATQHASGRFIARVHLDAIWWGARNDAA